MQNMPDPPIVVWEVCAIGLWQPVTLLAWKKGNRPTDHPFHFLVWQKKEIYILGLIDISINLILFIPTGFRTPIMVDEFLELLLVFNSPIARSAICGESLVCIKEKLRTSGQIRWQCYIECIHHKVYSGCTICKVTGFEKKVSNH